MIKEMRTDITARREEYLRIRESVRSIVGNSEFEKIVSNSKVRKDNVATGFFAALSMYFCSLVLG